MTEAERKKPFLIAMAMVVFGFISVVGGLAMSVILLVSLLGDGPYRMNGELVSKAEFLRFLIPFGVIYLTGCGIMGAIARLIHKGDPRSRPLLFGYASLPLVVFPIMALWLGSASSAMSGMGAWIPIVLLAWLYLYRKDSVVMYYSELEWAGSEFLRPASGPHGADE